jgi:hypothetical protein
MFEANVIRGGTHEFDSILYPQQNQRNDDYIKQTLMNIPTTLVNAGTDLFTRALETYKTINSSEMVTRARNALRAAKGVLSNNTIIPLLDVSSMQSASLFMQRWIMAEPTIRNIYNEQLCDGYSSTYQDMHPGDIGEDHYDWRRVMDGVVQYNEKSSFVKFYIENLVEGDRELIHDEKVDILSTWDIMKMAVSSGMEDPTDPFGGKIG